MGDEMTKLKQKITELEFKLKEKTLDLKECKAKLAEQKSKLAEKRSKFAEYKATHEIRMLESIKKETASIDITSALKKAQEQMKNVGTGEDKNP